MATRTSISELHAPGVSDPDLDIASGMEKKEDNLSLLDVLVVVVDHRRFVGWFVAVVTGLAVIVSLLLPKSYTAITTILPPQQSSGLGAILASEFGGSGGGLSSLGGGMAALAGSSLGLKNPNDRYVGMLRSHVVEDAVIKQFGLEKEYHVKLLSEARTAFEHHSEIDGNAKDGLIHISVVDQDPRKAAAIANGYVDQFRDLSQHLAVGEASERRLFFEQQLEQAKDKLANAEEALKDTEQKTGLIQLDSQARALIETAASLRAQIAARETMIQGMQTYATGQNAQMVEAQQELDSLRAQLAKLGGNQETDDGLIVPKGLVPQVGLEYLRKLRDVKYYQTMFEVLAQQYELAKLDEAREGSIIQVVDPAMIPDRRSSPKRAYIVLGSFAAGLILSLLAVFAMAVYERASSDPESALKIHHIRNALAFRRRTK